MEGAATSWTDPDGNSHDVKDQGQLNQPIGAKGSGLWDDDEE